MKLPGPARVTFFFLFYNLNQGRASNNLKKIMEVNIETTSWKWNLGHRWGTQLEGLSRGRYKGTVSREGDDHSDLDGNQYTAPGGMSVLLP